MSHLLYTVTATMWRRVFVACFSLSESYHVTSITLLAFILQGVSKFKLSIKQWKTWILSGLPSPEDV